MGDVKAKDFGLPEDEDEHPLVNDLMKWLDRPLQPDTIIMSEFLWKDILAWSESLSTTDDE